MLNNVSTGINAIARNVIINHPNTFNCEVYRREVLRVSDGSAGGAPTMGGMMVLSVEDESEITWSLVGVGYALSAETFQPSQMMDRRDANNGYADEIRFLVEPEAIIGDPGGFEVKKDDVMYLVMGIEDSSPRIAYEIIGIETVVNVPPYVPRYITNRRDDLDVMDPTSSDD